jgi:hypothetical protein
MHPSQPDGLRHVRVGRVLLATGTLLFTLAGPSAHAVSYDCGVSGRGGTFQVRKLVVTGNGWGTSLSGSVSLDPAKVATTERKHIFGGIWIVRAADEALMSYAFLEHGSSFDPPSVRATFQGQGLLDVSGASTDLIVDGHGQGAWAVNPGLGAGTYYVIGFGTGTGSYKFGFELWDGRRETPDSCQLIEVPGEIMDVSVADFQGGTQVMLPGYGTATDAAFSLRPHHAFTVGGIFIYEPSPYPPAELTYWVPGQTERHTERNTILPSSGRAGDREWRLSYSGETTTIGADLLMFDLPS